jgi:NAD(P)-dependent dehydrogenase (short-subunit alcohol dehydrogenase family)
VIDVNLKGVFLCSKMVIREMGKAGGGIIVNVASESGIVGEKNSVAYNASKAGVVILTKCMALDHGADNIRINCVCPGQTLTPMLEQTIKKSGNPDQVLKNFQSMRPIHRLGKPEEIANAILYLASEEAGYVIGSTLVIDGGYTAQ